MHLWHLSLQQTYKALVQIPACSFLCGVYMLSSCMCKFSLDTPVSSRSPKSCFIVYLLTLNCPKDVNMSGYICDGLASHPGCTPPLTNSGWRPWKGLNGLTRQMDGWKWALKFTLLNGFILVLLTDVKVVLRATRCTVKMFHWLLLWIRYRG